VAITTYAPADRFFHVELSRVNEVTIYGISIFWLLPDYSKIKEEAPSNSSLLLKNSLFYVTQINLSLEANSKVFNLIISAQHISAIYLITSNWLTTALALCNVMVIKNKDLLSYRFTSEF